MRAFEITNSNKESSTVKIKISQAENESVKVAFKVIQDNNNLFRTIKTAMNSLQDYFGEDDTIKGIAILQTSLTSNEITIACVQSDYQWFFDSLKQRDIIGQSCLDDIMNKLLPKKNFTPPKDSQFFKMKSGVQNQLLNTSLILQQQ